MTDSNIIFCLVSNKISHKFVSKLVSKLKKVRKNRNTKYYQTFINL